MEEIPMSEPNLIVDTVMEFIPAIISIMMVVMVVGMIGKITVK